MSEHIYDDGAVARPGDIVVANTEYGPGFGRVEAFDPSPTLQVRFQSGARMLVPASRCTLISTGDLTPPNLHRLDAAFRKYCSRQVAAEKKLASASVEKNVTSNITNIYHITYMADPRD